MVAQTKHKLKKIRKRKKKKKEDGERPYDDDEIEGEVYYYDYQKEHKEHRDDWEGMDYR